MEYTGYTNAKALNADNAERLVKSAIDIYRITHDDEPAGVLVGNRVAAMASNRPDSPLNNLCVSLSLYLIYTIEIPYVIYVMSKEECNRVLTRLETAPAGKSLKDLLKKDN